MSIDSSLKQSEDRIDNILVRLRDGNDVKFDVGKISNAIYKAFLACQGIGETKASSKADKPQDKPQDKLLSDDDSIKISSIAAELAGSVVLYFSSNVKDSKLIYIKEIQDQVELALMRAEYYDVAKAYVLYRSKRDRHRKIGEDIEKEVGKQQVMQVVKRDGTHQDVSLDKITNRVQILAKDLKVDAIMVSKKAVAGLYHGITTEKIDNYLSETAAALTIEHPDYSIIAARIKSNSLHKDTKGFAAATDALWRDGLLNEVYYKKVIDNLTSIESIIDYDKDYNYDYFALTTLLKAYLLKVDGLTVERPQDMLMRVALTCGCSDFDIEKVRTTYDLLSDGFYTHATPTLFNSGLKVQQLSSCFLIAMEDDSIEGIFNTLKDAALISKTAGGIGLHAHNIRCNGSVIKSTNGKSNGLIPFLKIFNETARSVDQGGGKRKGSFAVYLEPWHGDIIDFLELRKNTGAEEFRARDLFYALWVPDLFMQRVEDDGDWTLMSESMAPGLSEAYGDDFSKLYCQYEDEGMGLRTLKARTLMSKIVEAQIETGQPYMVYKDAVNSKSNQKNIGVIKSSNLCAEILEYSDKDETAVCNLASVALPKFVDSSGNYDYEGLYELTKVVAKNLDRVIDVNGYPTEKAERSNMRHRPIALGVQGLADVYFKMGIAYDSEKAGLINKLIFETVYFGAIEASMELARDVGAYSTYVGSPISNGQFQFDLWGVKPSGRWDWDTLRGSIKQYGLRNSLTTACMPTASTGIILGNTETFQIQTSNIYKRQTLSGEFMLINRHLVNDLSKRDLWGKQMRDNIILNNGSVQNIENFPEELKEIYKTVWEVSQRTVIDMAADRAPFIDQTQSMNLWLEKPTFGKVNSMHMYAWKKGLKTGMYYLRSRSAVDAVKVTVSDEIKVFSSDSSASNDIEDCLTCSA